MFEKNMKIGLLLDFYGDVLGAHTRDALEQYYSDDMSLSEIAEGLGISRQVVRHLIKKGEEELLFLEEKLGLAERARSLRQYAERLRALACELESTDGPKTKELAAQARLCADAIIE